MKNFIFTILLFLGLAIATPAIAGSISIEDFNLKGLTEAQKATLIQQAEKMKNEITKEDLTVKKVSEYTLLGKEVASAFIALATELGKSVDEVLTTTVGKVALALIIYKIAGNDILGLLGGIIWLLIFIPSWIYFFRKFMVIGTVTKEYDSEGKLKSKRVEAIGDTLEGDQLALRSVVFIVILLLGVGLELGMVFG